VQLHKACKFKFYVSHSNFLKILYSYLKSIINGQYDNNLFTLSLNITFYIILLYFIKIITKTTNQNGVYISIKIYSKRKHQKAQEL